LVRAIKVLYWNGGREHSTKKLSRKPSGQGVCQRQTSEAERERGIHAGYSNACFMAGAPDFIIILREYDFYAED